MSNINARKVIMRHIVILHLINFLNRIELKSKTKDL